MAKAFDATLNTLIDDHVADWAGFLAARCGVPPGPATPLDTDLSATLQADRLFRVDGPAPAVLHLELESNGRLGMPEELLRYNGAARAAVGGLPVHSVLVLLRPKANATDLTETLELPGADGRPYLTFRYAVVRVWQETVDGLLAAGPGLAPLALLTNEAAGDLPAAFGRFRTRLRAAGVPDNVEHGLMGSTFVLCGLRYEKDQIETLYRNLSMTLEDSTTYQLILDRGRAAEARGLILMIGGQRFGTAPETVAAAVRGITDRERLERVAGRLLAAAGWDDLLATP
ncbi:MAG: hypothetical protein C0501_25985 [Isosphaera sp.]|nr:hypothetical protein [Isosphaera sp.]